MVSVGKEYPWYSVVDLSLYGWGWVNSAFRGYDSFLAADGGGGGGGAQLDRVAGRRVSERRAAGRHRGRVPGSVQQVPVRAAMLLWLVGIAVATLALMPR